MRASQHPPTVMVLSSGDAALISAFSPKAAVKKPSGAVKKPSGAEKRQRRAVKQAAVKAVATPEEPEEVDERAPVFEVRSKAVLLTWQLPHGTLPGELFDAVDAHEFINAHVVRKSQCVERGSHLHAHVYLEFGKKLDKAPVTSFALEQFGPPNDVQANKATGTGYAIAAKRGHFYVANKFKDTFVDHRLTYVPGDDYTVKTQWVQDQWSQGKVTRAVECAAHYRCLTPAFEAMVSRSKAMTVSNVREEYRARKRAALASSRMPFRVYPDAVRFLAQFETFRDRYDFLWMHGPSKNGKGQIVVSWFKTPYIHEGSVDWSAYDPVLHDAIIFDDCKRGEMNLYILENKKLFQATAVCKVHTSATNRYAMPADTDGKPIVILTNTEEDRPEGSWVLANCIELVIDSPTWAPAELEDGSEFITGMKHRDDTEDAQPSAKRSRR